MRFLEELGKRVLVFDGAMGTMLQSRGLPIGAGSETWNTENPREVESVHLAYLKAGCDIIKTNTFGANAIKCPSSARATSAGVDIAREAIRKSGKAAMVALSVGPTGCLLKPFGGTDFEDAVSAFAAQIKAGKDADLVLIETFTDILEAKAAVIAAKENCSLPIIVTLSLDKNARLLTGGDIRCAIVTLEGLGVAALGLNCGLGPVEMEKIMPDLLIAASTPIVINPNAGLPSIVNGKTVYGMGPEEFALRVSRLAKDGVCVVGGCCGTTPEHIKALAEAVKGVCATVPDKKSGSFVSSYSRVCQIGLKPVIIGERLNPTGKPKLKQALKENDMDYVLKEAVSQVEAGADILDVNVGLPGLDESAAMTEVVETIESVVDLPLQIDTADVKTLENALRRYAGKPLVNSVNGKRESMDAVFPLVKKYGAIVVALTLDENGIPESSDGRIDIAKKIVNEAAKYGIAREDIIIDTLSMAVSAVKGGAAATLEALRRVKNELGLNTVLGVSNVSFGLPDRPRLNAAFFSMALASGLSAGIINPMSVEMTDAYVSATALLGYDEAFAGYISRFGARVEKQAVKTDDMTLRQAIIKGLKKRAGELAQALLSDNDALEVINGQLVPALDEVGRAFETGKAFLPQLLMSADAAGAAFEAIRKKLEETGVKSESRGKVLLATVEGDVHDIGKNIVHALLENYGFEVKDLGRAVPAKDIVDTALKEGIRTVGLSALMTTTVSSMEKTIRLLREAGDFDIMVGGAVLTEEYAKSIGADFFAADAMQSVRQALKWAEERGR